MVDDTIRCTCSYVGSATYRDKVNELTIFYFVRVRMVFFAFSELLQASYARSYSVPLFQAHELLVYELPHVAGMPVSILFAVQ